MAKAKRWLRVTVGSENNKRRKKNHSKISFMPLKKQEKVYDKKRKKGNFP